VKSFYFLGLFCFYSILGIQSQRLKFEHYNDGDGLSHNSVRHIVQDEKGFLWLGTFSGLNRFDGYQFKSYTTFSEEKTINNDDITALELDETTNKLWIGTRNGLTVLELETYKFTTFLPDENTPNGLEDAEIRGVYVDMFGRVWLGTKDKGVFIFHPKEERFEKIDIEGFEYVRNFFKDKNGNLWIGSFKGGIAKISLDNDGELSEVTLYDLLIPNSNDKNPYINFIYGDFKSDIFVGTREGLYKLDVSTNTFIIWFMRVNSLDYINFFFSKNFINSY
jgi:ligand-binding sensor domain-containing protein